MMTTENVKLKRLAPGLYEAPGLATIEHRPDLGGEWFVTYEGQSAPDDVYPRLRDARAALEVLEA